MKIDAHANGSKLITRLSTLVVKKISRFSNRKLEHMTNRSNYMKNWTLKVEFVHTFISGYLKLSSVSYSSVTNYNSRSCENSSVRLFFQSEIQSSHWTLTNSNLFSSQMHEKMIVLKFHSLEKERKERGWTHKRHPLSFFSYAYDDKSIFFEKKLAR